MTRHSSRRAYRWLAHITLAAAAFFYAYPFLWMLSGSFKKSSEFFSSGLQLIPADPQWSNYVRAWRDAHFNLYFLNTVIVAVSATMTVLLLTSLAGYTLARNRFSGRKIIIGIIVATLFLPRGYAILPIFDLVRRLGLLNTLAAVILVNAGTSMVVNTFLFMGYFSTLPAEIEEAALIDGANPWTLFWRIAIPLARPMVGTVALFEFMDNWNSFFIPLVFTLGRPELRTIGVGLYAFVGQNTTQWTLLCAAAVISLLPTMLLFFFLQRPFIDGIAGALKQ